MKRNHLLIVADSCITRDTRFYNVAVGESKAEIRCSQYITVWAVEHGHYFERYSAEVDLFLKRIADSLSLTLSDLPFMAIGVADLVRHIREFGDTPKIPPMSHTAAYCREFIKPETHFQRLFNVIRKAEAERRNKPKAICVSTHGLPSPRNSRPKADGRY